MALFPRSFPPRDAAAFSLTCVLVVFVFFLSCLVFRPFCVFSQFILSVRPSSCLDTVLSIFFSFILSFSFSFITASFTISRSVFFINSVPLMSFIYSVFLPYCLRSSLLHYVFHCLLRPCVSLPSVL